MSFEILVVSKKTSVFRLRTSDYSLEYEKQDKSAF
jgi:hypothetical protein